ncbi:MAG: enoyl-CoA hydratase/isomerase family protein [Deltaproteobacteria bacterium]|nr:enoyl-CoA hydratase/isomerase family protein [Deltaproteobacteria bacterium]
MDKVAIEPRKDVAIIRLTHGVTNPIGPELVEELGRAFEQAGSEFRGVVLAGGKKFFSIGFDLPALLYLDRKGMSDFFHGFGRLLMEMTAAPVPTASAVCGHAVAGGTILMLATDYRIAATGRTLIGLNESRLGVPVPYAADLLLRHIAGDRVATDMAYRGELLEASRVEESGVVDQVAEKNEVEGLAVETVAEIAALPRESFAAIKENRIEAVLERYEKHGWAKNERFLDIWFSPEAQEGLKEAASTF